MSSCATFRLHGARGGTPGWGAEHTAPPPQSRQRKRRPTAEESGSRGEALEEAAVGTVGKRGGRPGPHPKPNKGWRPSGACMRRVPLGAGRVPGEG